MDVCFGIFIAISKITVWSIGFGAVGIQNVPLGSPLNAGSCETKVASLAIEDRIVIVRSLVVGGCMYVESTDAPGKPIATSVCSCLQKLY